MKASDFRAPQAGRVIQTATGYTAFIPTPLPPALVYDAALVLALSRADTALGELAGLGRQLPNPNLLIGPYIRREAVLSSRIEGTRTSLSELLLDEVDDLHLWCDLYLERCLDKFTNFRYWRLLHRATLTQSRA